MSTTPLHNIVKTCAGTKPALVFSIEALKGFLLNNFKRAKGILYNNAIPIEGFPSVSARFSNFSIDPNAFNVVLNNNNNEIFARLAPDFIVTVEVVSSKNNADVFSEITLTVSNFQSRLTANAPYLTINKPEFSVTGSVAPHQNRKNSLNNSGIDEIDVVRVEGALAHIMPRRLIVSAFSTIGNINLEELFPAFELKGSWDIMVPNTSEAVLMIPSDGIVMREKTGCPTKDSVPDLSIETDHATKPKPENCSEQYKWPIKHSPIITPVNGKATNGNPFAGVYLPQPVFEKRFTDFIPAVILPLSGDGFISYNGRALVSFSLVKAAIDYQRRGFVVDFNFEAKGRIDLSIDVPCIGREHLVTARFDGLSNNLRLFLALEHTPQGQLNLTSQVDNLSIGDIDVSLSGFSGWLYLLGARAIAIQIIAKLVCEPILENMFPAKMQDAIKRAVNSFNVQLLNIESLQSYTEMGRFTNATYSGDDDSTLIGITGEG